MLLLSVCCYHKVDVLVVEKNLLTCFVVFFAVVDIEATVMIIFELKKSMA